MLDLLTKLSTRQATRIVGAILIAAAFISLTISAVSLHRTDAAITTQNLCSQTYEDLAEQRTAIAARWFDAIGAMVRAQRDAYDLEAGPDRDAALRSALDAYLATTHELRTELAALPVPGACTLPR